MLADTVSSSPLTHPSADAASHHDMANAIRALSMDAVEQANSGHPGMPMGMADVATVLWGEVLKHNPEHTEWPDRDRFVLSAGHGSMLLYSLMYLTGYSDITLDQIKQFRQLGARTAGHPEYGHAAGIETTTGPLGQGIANAVGMALAERMMASRFGDSIVDHYTYAIAGDGCLMEGISHEAASFAGHLKLSKLIVLFDDNNISIDGPTSLSVSDDQLARFTSYGWDVMAIDGHDPVAILEAIYHARTTDKPSLIACKTTIGKGAPTKAGKSSSHGSPLGSEEIDGARAALGWSHAPFEIPKDILSSWRATTDSGKDEYTAWCSRYDALDGDTKALFERMNSGDLGTDWQAAAATLKKQLSDDPKKDATRKSSGNALEVLVKAIPNMIGGSADLTGSNNTNTSYSKPITAEDFSGDYIYYGVREHAMGAIMNGMALHGGFIPYSGTFLVFSDYARPAIRLSALMEQRVIYVMTHDSIGLGEDGPTHQPVEHLASLRAIPNLLVFRPADGVETLECWQLALMHDSTPSLLALSRQGLPQARLEYTDDNLCARGGYLLHDAPDAKATLIATGSEVMLAAEAAEALAAKGINVRVVSMPCTELFDQQPEAYRKEVLGSAPRIAIEAASGYGWERYIGENGHFIGMAGFGASAPADKLYEHFGITAQAIIDYVEGL